MSFIKSLGLLHQISFSVDSSKVNFMDVFRKNVLEDPSVEPHAISKSKNLYVGFIDPWDFCFTKREPFSILRRYTVEPKVYGKFHKKDGALRVKCEVRFPHVIFLAILPILLFLTLPFLIPNKTAGILFTVMALISTAISYFKMKSKLKSLSLETEKTIKSWVINS